jgi:hypothetical protein
MLILLCLVTGTVTCSDGQGWPESSEYDFVGRAARLGRLAVDSARADPDDQGTAAFPAYSGPRRAGPYPDGNPHGTSLPLVRFRDTLITVLPDGRR